MLRERSPEGGVSMKTLGSLTVCKKVMWALLAQLVQQQLPQQQAALASLTAAVNQYGKTHGPGIALLEACHSGSALLVAALLELGVSAYNVRDGNGLMALHSAVISNDAPTVSALFPPSPRVSTAWLLTTLDHDMQWTPLHVAARPGGSVAIIRSGCESGGHRSFYAPPGPADQPRLRLGWAGAA